MPTTSIDSAQFSPLMVSPSLRTSQGKNLVGNPRLIRDLSASIHSSIQQWNALHLSGIDTLKIIINSKTGSAYLEELREPCEELERICDGVDRVVDDLGSQVSQIRMTLALHKSENNLFSTWPGQKFIATAQDIHGAYSREAVVKRIILENVAHDHGDSWDMLHLAAWVHQTQVSDSVTTSSESMLIETNLR